MKWSNNLDWIANVKQMINEDNDCTKEDMREAFMHLAFLYAADFINLHNLENFVLENHDEEVLEDLVDQSEESHGRYMGQSKNDSAEAEPFC